MSRNQRLSKSALLNEISARSGYKRADVDRIFSHVPGAIADAVANGYSVSLNGFGTFKIRDRAAHIGRNPKTGESINIPAKSAIAFKASSSRKA